MRSPATRHLGLDLGGTNVKWVAVERAGDDWDVLDRGKIGTAQGGPENVIAGLIAVGARAIDAVPGIASIGIGVPGLYDPATGAARFLPNVPGEWADRPVAAPVRDALGLPTSLINDARAFGLAEQRLGAGRGATTMVGLVLGTGVGGVVVIDGRVHFGHEGTGGEAGHQTIIPDGPLCTCGNRGCLEALTRADQIAAACGTVSAEEAVAAARAGDPVARAGLERIGRYIGIGIANLIVVLNPERVVIGGGVAAAGDLLLRPITDEVRRRVRVTSLERVEIVTAELGAWAGAIGAALHGAEQVSISPAEAPGPPAREAR